MNKKLITLVIGVLVIIGIGATLFFMNRTTSNNESINNNVNGSNANNETNNNEEENKDNGNQTITGDKRTLVLYFSMSGNTETVANFIHDEVGGDIVKLETVKNYPSDYNDLVDYAQEEQRKNERPELKTKINVDDYDVIFLGYPNWWGDMPMPIYTFLDEYDLSGKVIAPFITHGGSGLSGTPSNIQDEEKNATVTEGLAVSGPNAKNSKGTVENWLSKIDY